MSITKDGLEANGTAVEANGHAVRETTTNGESTAPLAAPSKPKPSLDTASVDNTAEFSGDVDTNNNIPTMAVIEKVADLPVLDKDGKSRPFKSLYSGSMVAKRVLVIFVRHFFCGVSSLEDLTIQALLAKITSS